MEINKICEKCGNIMIPKKSKLYYSDAYLRKYKIINKKCVCLGIVVECQNCGEKGLLNGSEKNL